MKVKTLGTGLAAAVMLGGLALALVTTNAQRNGYRYEQREHRRFVRGDMRNVVDRLERSSNAFQAERAADAFNLRGV